MSAFHRFTQPAYAGAPALPAGPGTVTFNGVDYSFINVVDGGTGAGGSAFADAAKIGGANDGTFFIAFGEEAISSNANRGFRALAENTDYLDDVVNKALAIPTRTSDVTPGADVTSFVLPADTFVGSAGTPNTADGIETFIQILDALDNEIDNGGHVRVTSIVGATPGDGFAAGAITCNVSPAIPSGTTYRVYYGTRGSLATLPEDALTNIKIRGAQEVPADLLGTGGAALIGTAAGPAWADATTNPAATVQVQLNKIVSDLAAATGAAKIGFAGSGAWADATTNPATDIETQLDKIISDLAGNGGTAKIGGAAVAGAPLALVAGPLATQLSDTASQVNTNASNISTNAADIVTIYSRTDIMVREPGLRLNPSNAKSPPTGAGGSSTLWYVPYKSAIIDLYDGSAWVPREAVTTSLSLAGAGTANYDIFAYWTGAAVALERVAWTNDTTRATALTTQHGVLVKSGDPTRRYVGTIHTETDLLNFGDNIAYCWNMYNRLNIRLKRVDTTDSWTTFDTSWHQANVGGVGTANRFQAVFGLQTELSVDVSTHVQHTASGFAASVGVGIDSTTVNSAPVYGGLTIANVYTPSRAHFRDYVAEGRHDINWLEIVGGGTITFLGDLGVPGYYQAGMVGQFLG